MSNGSEGRGERQRREKEQRERCRKSVHMVASDTQVLGAVLFQPNAESHLCIKQKNGVRKYSPFFPPPFAQALICISFFLTSLLACSITLPPFLPSYFPRNVISRSVSGIFRLERNAKADCRLSFCSH